MEANATVGVTMPPGKKAADHQSMIECLGRLAVELEAREIRVRLRLRKGRPPRLMVAVPRRDDCVVAASDTDGRLWLVFSDNTLIDRATETKAAADRIQQELTTRDSSVVQPEASKRRCRADAR